jgi:hypothetical protein
MTVVPVSKQQKSRWLLSRKSALLYRRHQLKRADSFDALLNECRQFETSRCLDVCLCVTYFPFSSHFGSARSSLLSNGSATSGSYILGWPVLDFGRARNQFWSHNDAFPWRRRFQNESLCLPLQLSYRWMHNTPVWVRVDESIRKKMARRRLRSRTKQDIMVGRQDASPVTALYGRLR